MKRIAYLISLLVFLTLLGCGSSSELPPPGGGGGGGGGGGAGFVNYTVPNDGDSGIASSSIAYIVFNQGMNDMTVNESSLVAACDTITEPLTVSYESANTAAKIEPVDGAWPDAALCVITAKGASLRDANNNLMGQDFIFDFKTASGSGSGTTDLTVDFTVPIDGATGVTVTEPFNMIFNQALNPMTVVESSFAAACGSATSQTPVSGFSVEYNSSNKAVAINPPSEGWPGSQVCKVTARANYVKDSTNNPLKTDASFTFTTGAGAVGVDPLKVDYAIPVPPANQVAVDTELTFIFNKALNAVTVVPTAFTAICGTQSVNGFEVVNVSSNNSVKLTPPADGWGNGALCTITIKKDSLWAADDKNMEADYTYTFSTITTSGVTVNRLALRSDKYTVKSTGTDQATLTVSAVDVNGATIPDVNIQLSTDRGELNASQVTTGVDGKASFTFNADTSRSNGVATISATTGVVTPVSLPIAIDGTTLVLTADKTVTKTGLPDDITLTGTLKDADSIPIVLGDVTITSPLGNTLKDEGTGASGSTITVKTDNSGQFVLGYTAVNVGEDNVSATGFGATGTTDLTVTNASFAFVAPEQNAIVNCNGTATVKLHWTDAAGAAVVGKAVMFTATNGNFGGVSAKTVNTNASGDATVTYTAAGIASPDTIGATAASGTDTLTTNLVLDIRANNPTQLDVQATPTVIGVKTAGNTPTSTIIATVRDPNGNPVAGQSVSFALVQGAGGGEYLSPAIANTDSAGQAKTTFYAGTVASQQNGVTIRGSISGLTDTVNLTISSAAASIIFGTTNKIGTVTVGGYPVGYEYPISLLVTDINGGPVANQPISIGIYPAKFRTGIFGDDKPSAEFVNEDLNHNAILDSGEDGAKGKCIKNNVYNSCSNIDGDVYYHSGGEDQTAVLKTSKDLTALNNRLDPRNVATVPVEVITDENGLALVKIIYAKSFCNWVDVDLSATTQVSGTETKAVYSLPLPCMANDPPYANSPFGY